MNYLFAGVMLLAPAAASAATSVPDSTIVSRQIEFQDQHHRRVKSAEGAAFRVETTVVDSLRRTRRIFYLPGGKLHSYAGLLKYQPGDQRHGAYLEYYENGQLRVQETYLQGQAQGPRLTYYPTGVLRRREQVVPGQPTTGECFGPDGQPVAYMPYQVMPEYPGGREGLLRDLGMNVRYPAEALRAGVSGTVLIAFRISTSGQPEDMQPLPLSADASVQDQRAYSYLQSAALEAARKLRPFVPGRLEGEPVAVDYTVPVTFMLHQQSSGRRGGQTMSVGLPMP